MIRPILILSLSLVWSFGSAIVRLVYRVGLKSRVRLPVRVVSVGNFEVGGTGKTPVVAQIAREALSRGLLPVILTRGYRGTWEKVCGIIPPGSDDSLKIDPNQCGDEAALLKQLVPDCWMGVGANRREAFSKVLQKSKELGLRAPSLVILDDGLQHHALSRDLDIILMTSARPWEKVFRELPWCRRNGQSLLIWTKGSQVPFGVGAEENYIQLTYKLPEPSDDLSSTRLWVVTGVADGDDVIRSLARIGWVVEKQTLLPDHSSYEKGWIEDWIQRSKSMGLKLATTGKDWVKWRYLGISRDSVLVFEPEIILKSDGSGFWSQRLWEEKR